MKKSDRKKIRQLADRAWESELRSAIVEIGKAIAEMEQGTVSPFDVDRQIHEYHNGTARDLYSLYSGGGPWMGICKAYYKGILSDEDLVELSEEVRCEMQGFSESLARLDRETKSSPSHDK